MESKADSSEMPQVLSHEAYNAVIDNLTPIEVRLSDLSFSLKGPVYSGPLFSNTEMESPSVVEDLRSHDGAVFVSITHQAVFRIVASDESIAAEGRAKFLVRLRLTFRPPENFWPVFLHRNVKLYTHPMLRDLIASLAARAGLLAQPLGSVAVTQAVSIQSLPEKPHRELPDRTD